MVTVFDFLSTYGSSKVCFLEMFCKLSPILATEEYFQPSEHILWQFRGSNSLGGIDRKWNEESGQLFLLRDLTKMTCPRASMLRAMLNQEWLNEFETENKCKIMEQGLFINYVTHWGGLWNNFLGIFVRVTIIFTTLDKF